MKRFRLLSSMPFILTALLPSCKMERTDDQLVRLAVIVVDPAQLDTYNELLKKEIEASIRIEPGVITLYGVAEKDRPDHVTLFETYADSSRYKEHLLTPHFLKYKNGTLQMVKKLQLIQSEPIIYVRKADLSNTKPDDLFVRLIKIVVDSTEIENFKRLGKEVMLPGIKDEPGVLVMYGVAEKDNPAHISILEVYADSTAYQTHVTTPHYLTYKRESKRMIREIKFIDAQPIFLGSKPQEQKKQ